MGAVQWGGVLLSVIGLAMINSPSANETVASAVVADAASGAPPHERQVLLANL